MRKLERSIGNLRFILRSMFTVLLPTMLRVFLQHTSFTAKISLYRFFTLINHRQRREIRSRIRNKFPTASHTSEKPFLGYVVHIISLLAQGKGGRCWFDQPSITLVMKCCFRSSEFWQQCSGLWVNVWEQLDWAVQDSCHFR